MNALSCEHLTVQERRDTRTKATKMCEQWAAKSLELRAAGRATDAHHAERQAMYFARLSMLLEVKPKRLDELEAAAISLG